MSEKTVVTSEIGITLKVIGGKWKPLILEYLRMQGTKRYSEILRYLEHAPKKTLTAQLRELEEDGSIERNVIPTVPRRELYPFPSNLYGRRRTADFHGVNGNRLHFTPRERTLAVRSVRT